MKKVHLGLDLGIASVGWSLVDDQQNIIAMGSHLFKQLSDPDDEKSKKYGEGTRGEKRRARRNLSRKKQRKLDFLNMIDQFAYNNQVKLKSTGKLSSLYKSEYQDIFNFNENESATDFLFHQAHKYDFYKIYQKGFETELKPKELFLFLYQKLSNRGAFYLKTDKTIEIYGYDQSLFKNILLDQYFKKNHKFRDKSNSDNSYSIFWNWLDIEFILRKCSYINQQFIEDYKKIFLRQRHFAYGPGWANPQSPWSVEYDENHQPIGHIWDQKIGFCPISLSKNQGNENKAQKRLNQFYFIAQLSSLVSQLVYTKLDGHNLNYQQILTILNKSIFQNEKVTIKNIAKWLNRNENDFSGYPRNKTLTEDNYNLNQKLRNFFINKNGFIEKVKNKDIAELLDSLILIDKKRFEIILEYSEMSKGKEKINNKDYKESLKKAKNLFKDIKFEFEINYENFVNFNDVSQSDLNGTREFGFDAYEKYLNYFFNTSSNDSFNTFDSFNVYFKKEIKNAERYKYNLVDNAKFLPLKMFAKQEFLSPNVKNTLQESIRVINNILRRYIYKNKWTLESIILETTWDNNDLKKTLIKESINSEARKKEISEYQKFMEESYKVAENELKKNNLDSTKTNKRKYFLWTEQDSKDFYSGKPLELKDIDKWQIDHIIPESISFNSNLENLVVTLRNGEKGKRTPFEFLGSEFGKFKNELWRPILNPDDNKKNNKKSNDSIITRIRKKRFKYLTIEKLEDEILGFINSNLSETTYAIRKLKDGLVFFMKNFNEKFPRAENEIIYNALKDCHIRTISGSHSQRFRKWMNLDPKDRKIKTHHAHDATIIAFYSSLEKVDNWYKWMKEKDLKVYYATKFNKDRFENQYNTIDFNYLKGVFSNPKNQFKERINNAPFYYSFKPYKLDPKLNNQFYKESLEKQWEIIKSIKPKQIFANENFNGYQIIDETKYEVLYWNLLDENKTKNVFELFCQLHNYIIEGKTVEQYCKEKKVLTNSDLIEELYKLVDKDLLNNTDKNVKKHPNLFKIVNEKLKSDISVFDNLTEFETKIQLNKLDNQKEYLNQLLNNYILIIKGDKLIKINKIKIISSKEYNPTYQLVNKKYKTKSSENKYIFEKEKQLKLSHNQTLYGDRMKMIVLLKYKDKNNKEKMNFFKINQLNQIVRPPKEYEIIKLIDPNIWYYYNNEIWKISSLDICEESFGRLEISCKSNENIKLRKSYSKGKWGDDQELFNKIMRKD